MATCGACQQEITVCNTCSGNICVVGCPDRQKLKDGCTCEAAMDVKEETEEKE